MTGRARALLLIAAASLGVAAAPLAKATTAATAGAQAAAGSARGSASPGASTAHADDPVLARAYIPSSQRVHGEVRLVRRGDALCMQTLIYSNALRRGVDRIRKRELYHWPQDRPGAADSARYLDGLEQAKLHVVERFSAQEPEGDRQRLLIEFVLGRTEAHVGFYDVEVGRVAEGFEVRSRTEISGFEASREYVGRAMRIQGEEGFDPLPAELAALPR